MQSLICVPTYNERDNIAPLAHAIFENVPLECHILFIDDNSPDGTGALADEMAKTNPRIHVLHRQQKEGLAAAYLAGFKWGLENSYEWIFEMDADFSHQPMHLKEFFKEIHTGKYDAVCGSRYVAGGGVSNWSRSRLLLSRMGSLYAGLLLNFGIKDWTGGFNAWKKSTLMTLDLSSIQSKGYAFQIELKYRCTGSGLKLKEIPIIFQERRVGQSKMSGSIVKEALVGVLKLRFTSDFFQRQKTLKNEKAHNGSQA